MAATVSFRLNRPKEKDGQPKTIPCGILIKYYRNGIEIELSTGEKVTPANFTGTRVSKETPFASKINKILSSLEYQLLNIEYDKLTMAEEAAMVRAIVKRQDQKEEKKTLIQGVEQFIAQYEREKDSKTVKRYRVLLNKLKAFNPDLTFEELDYNFYSTFKNWLYDNPNKTFGKRFGLFSCGDGQYEIKEGEGGQAIPLFDDVVFKYFVNLKTICAWAEKRGYFPHKSYKEWEIIKREYPPITLSEEELIRIEMLNLPKHLDTARDFLVLECRTGQRISDIRAITKESIQDDIWNLVQKKGNRIKVKHIEFPINEDFTRNAKVILEKYNYRLPSMPEQNINKYIKQVCKQAGIDQPIFIERWAGNKKIRIPGKKYEFLSTHTGKKSFITILASQGTPVAFLSALTGTSQKTIERHYLGKVDIKKVKEYLNKSGKKVNMKIA
jgi:integrase